MKYGLLEIAAEECGFDTIDEMLESMILDSVVPGICPCGYITNVEPDGYGWCEECENASCESIMLLAGII